MLHRHTVTTRPHPRSDRADAVRRLAGPLLLISATGAVAILFLYSCARQAELELRLLRTESRVQELDARGQRLAAQIEAARDPVALRRFAQEQGMSSLPAGVDRIRLDGRLPEAQWAISPVAALQPPQGVGPAPEGWADRPASAAEDRAASEGSDTHHG